MPSQNRRCLFSPTKNGSSFARRLHVETLEDRRLLAVFSVDNLNDSGAGSLREAIGLANADAVADEITFSVNGTIDLASQLPSVNQPLTITGPGADLLTLDAGDGTDNTFATGDGYRIFLISSSTPAIDVEISGLTLTGGDTGTVVSATNRGGAIRNIGNLTLTSTTIARNAAPRGGGIDHTSLGTLTVIDSTIEENHAIGGTIGHGGGIYTFGDSTIKSSTLSGNTAAGRGGGFYGSSGRTATVTGSTFSGNSAGTFGGGLAVFGDLNISGSTVTDNEATTSGGGILISNSPTVNSTSSIVAGNRAGSNDNVVQIFLDTNSHNLIGGDPLLGPLADNGGPTKTHALLPGSPALDAGLSPVHDYELDGTLADAMGGPDLAALGGSIFIPAGEYHFGPNQGLNLSSANIAPDDYTIEIDFSFDELSGFQKVIDFKDLAVDGGLYTHNATLRFYNPSISSGDVLTVDTLHHLVITRDGATEEVSASIDGVEAFRFVDTTDAAVFSATDQIIRFFQDDNATSQLEAESGFVDRIRLFDAALELNDQRGAMFNRVVGTAIDIGAYEAQLAPSADFDSDGDVDGSDFLAWQRGFGKANAALADGNSDDDTDTDASDLAAWSATFGQQEQEASSLVAPFSSGQPSAGSADLIDAALATEWLDFATDDQPSAHVARPSTTEDTITTDDVVGTTPFAAAAGASAKAESLATQSREVDESADPWLSEQLLQQVFS